MVCLIVNNLATPEPPNANRTCLVKDFTLCCAIVFVCLWLVAFSSQKRPRLLQAFFDCLQRCLFILQRMKTVLRCCNVTCPSHSDLPVAFQTSRCSNALDSLFHCCLIAVLSMRQKPRLSPVLFVLWVKGIHASVFFESFKDVLLDMTSVDICRVLNWYLQGLLSDWKCPRDSMVGKIKPAESYKLALLSEMLHHHGQGLMCFLPMIKTLSLT